MMTKMMTIRNLMWALALGVTIWLSINAPEKQAVVQAKRQVKPLQATTNTNAEVVKKTTFELVTRDEEVEVKSNLFGEPETLTAQTVRHVKTEEKPLALPPMPFQYLGNVIGDGKEKYFFKLDDQLLLVVLGDTLDERYKLVSIDKMGSKTSFKFLFLPMKLTQTMVVNNAN